MRVASRPVRAHCLASSREKAVARSVNSRPPTGMRGVWTAFTAPFRGLGTIMVRPRLWPWAATPTLLLVAAFAGGGTLARRAYDAGARWLAGALGSSWLGVAGAAVTR